VRRHAERSRTPRVGAAISACVVVFCLVVVFSAVLSDGPVNWWLLPFGAAGALLGIAMFAVTIGVFITIVETGLRSLGSGLLAARRFVGRRT